MGDSFHAMCPTVVPSMRLLKDKHENMAHALGRKGKAEMARGSAWACIWQAEVAEGSKKCGDGCSSHVKVISGAYTLCLSKRMSICVPGAAKNDVQGS